MSQTNEMLDEARYLKNELGDSKGAIRLSNKILKTEPENRDAMLIKAGALKEIGEVEEFSALIQNVIQKWPNHWEAYYLMSMYLFMMHKDEEALELMKHSINLDENFNNVISYAQIIYLAGSNDYQDYVEKAKKIDKNRADNFMKNVWVWDVNEIKPTLSERMHANKIIKKIGKK